MCFSDPDVVLLIDRATTKFAATQPYGSEKAKMAPITECRSLWNWVLDSQNLGLIVAKLLSMHTPSVCVRAQVVGVGTDVCQESFKAKN